MNRDLYSLKRKTTLVLSLIAFGALAVAVTNAQAGGVVQLPPRAIEICVKKSANLVKLSVQAEYWQVNGKQSGQSTWQYRGNASTVTVDFATADAVAYCRTPGVDTYDLAWKLAYADTNQYQMTYTVTCKVCDAPPRPVVPPRIPPRPAVPRAAPLIKAQLGNARAALMRRDYGSFGVQIHNAVLLAEQGKSENASYELVQSKLRTIESSLESRNQVLLLSQMAEVERMLESQ